MTMKNGMIIILLAVIAIGAILIINRENEGVFEGAGRSVDSTIENAGDEIEKATDKIN